MKKVRILFTAIAVVAAVGGAIAMRPCQSCTGQPQYYFDSGMYLPVPGEFPLDYNCGTGSPQNTCTFTKSGSTYVPCRLGLYSDN